MATDTVSNNLVDDAMDLDIPEATSVEVIGDNALPNSQNEVTLDRNMIASELTSEVPTQTATVATGHDYKSLIDTYTWDGCQTVELKYGHVLYMWIQSNYNLKDATKKLLYYLAPQNPSRLNSKNISSTLRQMHVKVQILKRSPKYNWETLVSLVQADFIIPSVQRRTISDGPVLIKSCPPVVQNLDTSDEVGFSRRRPMNAEIVRVEECSKCLAMKGEMSNYRKRIQGFRVRLAETRKELAAAKKIYNIKRTNQKMKRKNTIILKCKKDKNNLRLKIFSLQRENKKLKKKCERFLEKEKGRKWDTLRSMVKLKQNVNLLANDKESVSVPIIDNESVKSPVNDQECVHSPVNNTESVYSQLND